MMNDNLVINEGSPALSTSYEVWRRYYIYAGNYQIISGEDQVFEAFKLMLSDGKVKSVIQITVKDGLVIPEKSGPVPNDKLNPENLEAIKPFIISNETYTQLFIL